MKFSDYGTFDAVGPADLIRKKEARPAELLEAARTRAEDTNQQLNAIVTWIDDRHRQTEIRTDFERPFHGIPFLLKDLGAAMAGVPLSSSKEGLPIGLQFTAKPLREDILFRLAAQLEDAQPWREKVPPL